MKTTTICPACGVEFTRIHSASKPAKFCSLACVSGPNHPNFKGGWEGQGRYRLWLPPSERHLHPTCNPKGYVLRYHKVWNDAHPEDPVLPNQIIHHLNGDSLDDRIENLEKMSSQSPHAAEHFRRPRGPMSEAHKAALSAAKLAKRQVPDKDCENCGAPLTRVQILDGGRYCSHACMYAVRPGRPKSEW